MMIEREVRMPSCIGDLMAFQRFVELCAARTAPLVSDSSFSGDAEVSQPAAKAGLGVIEYGGLNRSAGRRICGWPGRGFLEGNGPEEGGPGCHQRTTIQFQPRVEPRSPRMEVDVPKYSKQELEGALVHYQEMARKSHATGDWTIFPQVFTEDAVYIDHCFGTMRGRKAITDWLVRCQEPFPNDMIFPLGWNLFDYDAGIVVMEVFNRLIVPEKPGLHFDLVNWTRLTYGGNGLWAIEEDIYNSVRMREVFDQWVAAGGKPRSTLMAMAHGAQ